MRSVEASLARDCGGGALVDDGAGALVDDGAGGEGLRGSRQRRDEEEDDWWSVPWTGVAMASGLCGCFSIVSWGVGRSVADDDRGPYHGDEKRMEIDEDSELIDVHASESTGIEES